jgi:predicted transcriptional regulator
LWQAIADEEVPAGTKLHIWRADGLVLRVSTKAPPASPKPSVESRIARFFRRKPA